MSSRLRCNVHSWDETRRTFAAVEDSLNAMGGGAGDYLPWQSYAVSVTDDAGTSVLGNSTLLGYWKRWLSTVLVSVKLTDHGSPGHTANGYRFSLPAACLGGVEVVGSAIWASKLGADPAWGEGGFMMSGACMVLPGGTKFSAYYTFGSTPQPLNDTWPTRYEDGDYAVLSLTYPVAAV